MHLIIHSKKDDTFISPITNPTRIFPGILVNDELVQPFERPTFKPKTTKHCKTTTIIGPCQQFSIILDSESLLGQTACSYTNKYEVKENFNHIHTWYKIYSYCIGELLREFSLNIKMRHDHAFTEWDVYKKIFSNCQYQKMGHYTRCHME